MHKISFKLAVTAACLLASAAHAGPFILAGTDADDHGSFLAGANQDGWLFMQRSIENLAASSALTNSAKVVVALGSDPGSSANTAALSAFTQSSLASSGWTFINVNGAANITAFLNNPTASIVMLDSGANITGGLDAAERAALTSGASLINNFVGNGGGLFSQANGYGWLSALVPGLTTTDYSDTGLALTAAGNAAFPGLNNGDLSAGPYHNYFNNVGSIPVLATGIGTASAFAVIIGAAGGSVTDPNQNPTPAIPEPSTYALMFGGLAAVAAFARRRRAAR
jgi:PEP-CTERM motif